MLGDEHMMLCANVLPADVGWSSMFITSISPDDYSDVLEIAMPYIDDSVVSAELGYAGGSYGMLRARASTVGPWEQFQYVWGGGVGGA
ncbi:hypothetical protein AB0I28_20960 [Phytomonospora sp. NPDC050363]|uniref:hypothetical protein n=1 Tax=Phytomonospora sp. NPDC050363 TaxID=3155642 RepID=UPI003404F652